MMSASLGMPASPADTWLAAFRERGLAAHAPAAVSALLAVLIAAELARIVLAFGGQTRPVRVEIPAPRHTAVDAQRIVAAHLFGAAPVAKDPDDAPLTAADLKLSGTIATPEPRHGFAIIVGGGISRFYAVGDPVGGAALHAVYLDHVILDRGGRLETLSLPHVTPAASQGLAHAGGATPPHGQFLDNAGRVVDHDPGVLDGIMRTIDVHDRGDNSGKIRGFRVYPVASGAALRILGLSPGDLLTSLNGVPLDDLKHGRELLEAVDSTGAASATVERQGQTLSVTLDVTGAAAELQNEAAAKGGPAGTARAAGQADRG
jgi:general secretion pathway protein C